MEMVALSHTGFGRLLAV